MLYQTILRKMDPNNVGLNVVCPTCGTESWILLPQENSYFREELQICCPAACGHYSSIKNFSPLASPANRAFDQEFICPRDNTEFKTYGAINRCPVCAIENPREVMNTCADRVLASTSIQSDDLSEMLGSLVSTFDGVMRQCNIIAIQNAASLHSSHPRVRSFQDVATAQQTLASLLDISKYVLSWPQFLETFQKRHALSHNLGVIDHKYVDKTGVSTSQVGKKVQLSKQEIDQFANDCKGIVRGYFAHFLS